MKLIYAERDLEIELSDEIPTVWTIEKQNVFTYVVRDLWEQTQGNSGNLSLFDSKKEKKIGKDTCLIMNPFGLDCNEKKVLTKLYSVLSDTADERFYEKRSELNSQIVSFVDELLQTEPYPFSFNLEPDCQALLKFLNVSLDYTSETLMEKVLQYVRIQHNICRIEVFIFIGLKAYLDNNELEQLYDSIALEHVYLLLVERNYYDRVCAEKNVIIDKDDCVIYI